MMMQLLHTMHINKHFLFVVGAPALLVGVIVFASMYRFYAVGGEHGLTGVESDVVRETDTELTDPIEEYEGRRMANPNIPTNGPDETLATDVFTGTLTRVDTGCFADGECYVKVDGNHVTAIMGWSQETVGTVQGVPGFGDLESHIGEQVEVFAQRLAPGNYTLYGSEAFYIRLLNGDVSIGQTEPGSAGPGMSDPMPPYPGVGVGEPNPSAPKAEAKDGCVVGGCSSQLCVEASNGDMVSTCEWRESYACYQTAMCERQSDGACGWTETPELTQCIATAGSGPRFIVQ
jgi:hypothetical protein